MKNFITSQTHDIYNWKIAPYPLSNLGPSASVFTNSLRFIPTIHSASDAFNAANIPNNVPKRGPIKTFNEPELAKDHIDVDYAHQLWMDHILPLANQGYELLSPSVTTGDVGFDWLTDFFTKCNNQCSVSAVDIHHYSNSAQQFINATERFRNAFHYQIWITETACQDYSGGNQQCNQDEVNAYYHAIMEYVLSKPYIEKIAYFGLFTPSEETANNVGVSNSMISCSGGNCMPNSLGYRFINAKS